jgi:hypothetical protein
VALSKIVGSGKIRIGLLPVAIYPFEQQDAKANEQDERLR